MFVLLVHYYNSRCKGSNSAPIIMSSPVKERSVIYILATVEAHSNIAYAVASFHGIGKATVVEVAKKGGFSLFCFGGVHAEIKYLEAQSSDAKPDIR